MMGDWDKTRTKGYLVTAHDYKGRNVVCSAAIAMRVSDVDKLRYDEDFIGSGYEDTDFCLRMKERYPEQRIVINNQCRLIHIHEGKGQQGKSAGYNKAHFESIWGK